MEEIGHKILNVAEGSIAEELELQQGDRVLEINGQSIEDVFDYHYMIHDEYIELLIEKEDGEQWLLEIDKEYDEDLGIEFGSGLMDEYKSCKNKCIFCFIDQMPDGMRETLYFKDDDSRLSFLQGNYVTLTNMKEEDILRIIKYKLSPINISFHATNPELRCEMLHNRFAGDIMEKTQMLYEAGVEMNGQIVLCKGVNDGEELERSISDLSRLIPVLKSVSVVPVGLTKYREGLYPLESFTKEDSLHVITTIHSWQERLFEQYGQHFIHAGDEWYMKAGQELPDEDCYDGYLQLENGVGMVRLFLDEVRQALDRVKGDLVKTELSIASGTLMQDYLRLLLNEINIKFPNRKIHLYEIKNKFFGERITVSGLITGGDLKEQLSGKQLGQRLLLPCNMMRQEEQVFLDDMTVGQLKDALQVDINIVKSSGQDFLDAILLERES